MLSAKYSTAPEGLMSYKSGTVSSSDLGPLHAKTERSVANILLYIKQYIEKILGLDHATLRDIFDNQDSKEGEAILFFIRDYHPQAVPRLIEVLLGNDLLHKDNVQALLNPQSVSDLLDTAKKAEPNLQDMPDYPIHLTELASLRNTVKTAIKENESNDDDETLLLLVDELLFLDRVNTEIKHLLLSPRTKNLDFDKLNASLAALPKNSPHIFIMQKLLGKLELSCLVENTEQHLSDKNCRDNPSNVSGAANPSQNTNYSFEMDMFKPGRQNDSDGQGKPLTSSTDKKMK